MHQIYFVTAALAHQPFRTSSGILAMFTAIRRASIPEVWNKAWPAAFSGVDEQGTAFSWTLVAGVLSPKC
jgi:hypothetical protein